MISDKDYIAFKERSRKHSSSTLKAFEFWGMKVGRIEGQIKSKWGETRWYAKLDAPESLHDIVYVQEFRDKYNWDPTKGQKYRILDIINNMSKFFSIFLYVFVLYKMFFYNVAYWVAIIKNTDCASDIVWSADYPKKILFGNKFANFIHKRNQRLLSKD
jgi:hypothetical protein